MLLVMLSLGCLAFALGAAFLLIVLGLGWIGAPDDERDVGPSAERWRSLR